MEGEQAMTAQAGLDGSHGWDLLQRGDNAAAWAHFQALLPERGDDPEVILGLAECLLRAEQGAAAERLLRDHPLPSLPLRIQLGFALQVQGKWAEAETEYRAVLAEDEKSPRARLGLGVVLIKQGCMAEARTVLERQLELYPDDGHAWLHMASIHRAFGHMAPAFAAYRHGLARLPEKDPVAIISHCELALTALALGDYATGFAELEWRLQSLMGEHVAYTRSLAPDWEGVVAQGRSIVLWYEQGLGDTIHFARYAQLLARMGMKVYLWAQPPLARLLRTLPDISGVCVGGDAIPHVDCQAPLVSVPHLLRLGGRGLKIPREVPYLFPDAAEVERWRSRIDPVAAGRRRIGIVWAGNPGFGLDHRRTLELESLAPILQVPGNAFFSLQMGAGRVSAERLARYGVTDLADQVGDFADTAAAMAALDMVISVDTSTVHCAGALGRPTWLPLYLPPDWRWGLNGDETIWYPTLRLFRQSEQGRWDDVIERMAQALAALDTGH